MAFRLFRRIKILPGVTLNLSKSGISTSIGPKGAKVTFGKRGVRKTVGIPGTGISFTETSRPAQKQPEKTRSGSGSHPFILLFIIVIACWLSYIFLRYFIYH